MKWVGARTKCSAETGTPFAESMRARHRACRQYARPCARRGGSSSGSQPAHASSSPSPASGRQPCCSSKASRGGGGGPFAPSCEAALAATLGFATLRRSRQEKPGFPRWQRYCAPEQEPHSCSTLPLSTSHGLLHHSSHVALLCDATSVGSRSSRLPIPCVDMNVQSIFVAFAPLRLSRHSRLPSSE